MIKLLKIKRAARDKLTKLFCPFCTAVTTKISW